MILIKDGFIRAIIPFTIMTIIAKIMNAQGIEHGSVKSTFITGVIIALVAGASVFYEIEQWSLLKQSLVHFIFMMLTVYPCLLFSGWFKINNVSDYIKVFGIFVIVGIVLWGLFYLIFGHLMSKNKI